MRIPHDLDAKISAYAADNHLSHGAAMMALIRKGLGETPVDTSETLMGQIMERLEALETIVSNTVSNKVSTDPFVKNGTFDAPAPGRSSSETELNSELAALLHAHGITSQAELIRKTGIPQPTISKAWRSQHISDKMIARITAALEAISAVQEVHAE